MDGVNVEQAIGRDRVRNALKRYENKPVDEHRYGLVRSVNADGSYEVLLDGDVQTSRCAQFDTALVGDRVIVVTKKDGTNDILGRLGGPIGGSSEGGSAEAMMALQVTTIWQSIPFTNAIVRITNDQIDSIYEED